MAKCVYGDEFRLRQHKTIETRRVIEWIETEDSCKNKIDHPRGKKDWKVCELHVKEKKPHQWCTFNYWCTIYLCKEHFYEIESIYQKLFDEEPIFDMRNQNK